jgi:hypothetical protein
MTELRAARNRMTFGEQEEEVGYGDETEGLGMAAKQLGKIRATQADQRNKGKTTLVPKDQPRKLTFIECSASQNAQTQELWSQSLRSSNFGSCILFIIHTGARY